MASRCYPNDPCEWMVKAIRACAVDQAMPVKFESKVQYGATVVSMVTNGVVMQVVACPACGRCPNAASEPVRWSRFSGGVTTTPCSGSYAAPMRGTLTDNNPEPIYGWSR